MCAHTVLSKYKCNPTFHTFMGIFLQVGSFLLGSFVGQAMEVTCMQRKLSAAKLSEPTIRAAWIWQSQSVRPQALSATSQMDAWGYLADGLLGQHYPRPRRWTLGQHYPRPRRWTLQHYPRPRRWTLTQGMEQTRCHGHAWQLTLF